MTSCHAFIAASLDGFIARPDGDIGWLGDFQAADEDHGYEAFIDGIDGLVMGRNTFTKVLAFGEWPYAKPVIVATRTLADAALPRALHDRVSLCAGTPAELVAMAAERGWRRVYVDGGRLIQSFIAADLLADMIVTRVPVLLGDGIPLFGPLSPSRTVRHVQTTAFPSGLVQSKYEFRPRG